MATADRLLDPPPPVPGVVDHSGRPIASRSAAGRWGSALFIIGVEMAERFAYYGINFNLITYLTGPLQQSTASAATAVNTWSGVACMVPFLGAFVADSWLGRYRTIVLASALYILPTSQQGLLFSTLQGLSMLTVLSLLLSTSTSSAHSSPPPLQVAAFYVALYLVALAQGGHKPCTQAFGADQFDADDPEEKKARSSFFNWWYFGMNIGILFTVLLTYVQDYVSWAFGFGISCAAMVLALLVFLAGTRTYRYCVLQEESPFLRIGASIGMLIRNWRRSVVDNSFNKQEQADIDMQTAHRIEEAKGVLRLFPIWATCLVYAIVFAQSSTFFTKQASTLDGRIGQHFRVPPASLQNVSTVTILLSVYLYDHLLLPASRGLSGTRSGITMLQRIGIGNVISIVTIMVAALVEIKRLRTAKEHGLLDNPDMPVPMSMWWLIPQYALFGVADVFTMVGLQEFFYDQVPDSLRSLGLALYLSIFGIGSFISGFLVWAIDKATANSGDSWFANNLNRAHLDYFYWLLAGLNAGGLIVYVYFAQHYTYKKREISSQSSSS